MHRNLKQTIALVTMLVPVGSVIAQEVGIAPSSFADGVLVTTKDVTTCPYRTIGPVSASASIEFSNGSQANLFYKLRLKAKKMGADAVVLVTLGERHMTAFSFGKRDGIGRAIQYVDRACAPTT